MMLSSLPSRAPLHLPRLWLWSLALLLCALHLAGQVSAVPSGVLTRASQVHDLSSGLAASHLPVHLVATATYYDDGRQLLYVQDESGGVFISTTRPYPIHRGDLLDITGVTNKSFYTTVGINPEIHVISHGPPPRPAGLVEEQYRDLLSEHWSCRLATVRGTVRSALIDPRDPSRMDLELLVSNVVMLVYIHDRKTLDPTALMDAEIVISGVVGSNFNPKLEITGIILYTGDADDLKVVKAPRKSFLDLPLTPVEDLPRTKVLTDQSQRVRIRGVVTFYRPGRSLVIRQNGRSVSAETWQRMALPLGSLVDLSGFAAEGDFGTVLKQVTIVPTGQVERVKPTPVTYAEAMTGAYNDELISVRGRLISQTRADSLDMLTLVVDHHAVNIHLEQSSGKRRIPDLALGTEIEVAGICRVTLTANADRPRTMPMFFRIEMRSTDDLKVISLPPWWTFAHLIGAVMILCVLSLLITLWAMALRRRVSQQTCEIKRSMQLERERSRLLEAISSDTPLPQVLADISRTFESLLPKVRCCSSTTESSHRTPQDPGRRAFYQGLAGPALFESTLSDGRGTVLGRFQAAREDDGALSSYELEVLRVAANLAELAVNQRRMYQELNYTSTHDQLTGLPNRRAADAQLEHALQQGDRTRALVAVAYIDVDRFKQVNDEHGHKAGDVYLQQIAARMRTAVRGADTLARIGGDEFLLIAPGIHDNDEAESYRARLQACFDETFSLDGVCVHGSASIGLALSPDHGTRAEDLKRRADLDMYAAKYQRRTGHDILSQPAMAAVYPVGNVGTVPVTRIA